LATRNRFPGIQKFKTDLISGCSKRFSCKAREDR
jgi:hypothetical protein